MRQACSGVTVYLISLNTSVAIVPLPLLNPSWLGRLIVSASPYLLLLQYTGALSSFSTQALASLGFTCVDLRSTSLLSSFLELHLFAVLHQKRSTTLNVMAQGAKLKPITRPERTPLLDDATRSCCPPSTKPGRPPGNDDRPHSSLSVRTTKDDAPTSDSSKRSSMSAVMTATALGVSCEAHSCLVEPNP